MTKVFNPNLEPRPLEDLPLIFVKNGYRKDGTPRKRKVFVKSKQGFVNARHYYYCKYHEDWNGEGEIILLDGDDTNMSEDNLILVSKKIAKKIISNYANLYYPGNPKLQNIAIMIAKSEDKIEKLQEV